MDVDVYDGYYFEACLQNVKLLHGNKEKLFCRRTVTGNTVVIKLQAAAEKNIQLSEIAVLGRGGPSFGNVLPIN